MYQFTKKDIEKIHSFADLNTEDLGIFFTLILKNPKLNINTQTDILWEIYTLLNLVPQEENPYYQYAKYLIKIFPDLKEKKILEPAAGIYPALSIALKRILQPNKAIRAMDPELTKQMEFRNIICQREYFHPQKKIDCDFVMAIRPNNLADEIAKFIVKNQLEGSIQLCSTLYDFDGNCYDESDKNKYNERVFNILNELTPKGFRISKEFLPYSIREDAPILTIKRVKE